MKRKSWQHLTWTALAAFLLVFPVSCNPLPSPDPPAAPDQTLVITTDPGLQADSILPASTSTSADLAIRSQSQQPTTSRTNTPVQSPHMPTQLTEPATVTTAPPYLTPKVFVLIFNPRLDDGRTLEEAMGFNDPDQLVQDYIDFLLNASSGRIQYSISTVFTLDDIPVKEDGFQYSRSAYLSVLSGEDSPHMPDDADYLKMLANPEYDLCRRLNRGEIDEVWLFAGPWMGFYESRLAGSAAFFMNGAPLDLPGCERLLPIMGFNYERGLESMAEDFAHRAEAVMTHVYGGWEQNRTQHVWDLFGLSGIQSPNYDYTGCGSAHYPPNARFDYDYNNPEAVDSVCGDFLDYPHLGHPLQQRQPIDCTAWDCTQLGYFHWWLSHFPQGTGTGAYIREEDWWSFIVDPNRLLPSSSLLPTSTPKPGAFTDLSASLPFAGPAEFRFAYKGRPASFIIEISTLSDMSYDVYLSFGSGPNSPILVPDPAAKWAKYVCGATLYWHVITAENVRSPIQSAVVTCPK